MQGTNVLFGQIAVVFGILIAGVWGATQWTAAALGYQVRLGSPWFDFLGTPIYHPWKLFEWWFVFDASRRACSIPAAPSRAAVGYWRWSSPSACRSGDRGSRAWSRLTARPAGRTRMTFTRRA